MLEAQKQFEIMTASSYPQSFQNSYCSFLEPPKEKSLLEKTVKYVQESEQLIQNMIDFQCPPNFHMTQE